MKKLRFGIVGTGTIAHRFANAIRNTKGAELAAAAPYAGNGFEEQIEHFCACVADGCVESPILTRAHTLRIIRLSDQIRALISLRYPQDAL